VSAAARRGPAQRFSAGIASLALLTPLFTACGSAPVEIDAPQPTGATADACSALAPLLPQSVLGFSRRPTADESPFTAAWGEDVLIVLRCGVSRPAALTPSAQVLEVNGVDWLPETFERGVVFTTASRTAYVEVQVPIELRPEARALVDLADAIEQAIPAGEPED
jgi:hypothetical protein